MRNFLLSVRLIFQFQFWPRRRYCDVILGRLLRKYDVTSLYQDGSRGGWILFPVSHCWYRCLQKVEVYEQTKTKFRRHTNWWLRYNYFRFLKRNVRHIGNLLSISTIWPKSAHYSASGYRISSKSKNTRRKYDVISISQHGGRDGWILLPVLYMLMSLPSESQSLLANQILSRWMNEWMNLLYHEKKHNKRYFHWRLRYNYFRFRNTNVRHIGILLLVSISSSSP